MQYNILILYTGGFLISKFFMENSTKEQRWLQRSNVTRD